MGEGFCVSGLQELMLGDDTVSAVEEAIGDKPLTDESFLAMQAAIWRDEANQLRKEIADRGGAIHNGYPSHMCRSWETDCSDEPFVCAFCGRTCW